MDTDAFWRSLGGGAAAVAALTLVRLFIEYRVHLNERRHEQEERRRRQQADAEARLERVLQDRLADADRRLEHFALDLQAERLRCGTLEHEHALLQQAHALLKEQHANLQAELASHQERSRVQAGN
ncbi:MAG TPA: hypothetical protein VKV73_33640 [Chloroflexota bacterium]|nr:hypothetical protein [Chloroflexota bacterium]